MLAAGHRSTPHGRRAFEQLCERYWYPLYAHARRREPDPHRARDLIQGFFERVIEKNYIADADPQRGRFRTFLLASFGNYVSNERDKANAIKRGGNAFHFTLDFDEANQRYHLEPADHETPALQYERLWARALLKRVLELLQQEYESEDSRRIFAELHRFLVPSSHLDSYATIGERLGMSEGAVKVAVHRMRGRYRQLLRKEIAMTIEHPGDVDDEISRLFEAFGS